TPTSTLFPYTTLFRSNDSIANSKKVTTSKAEAKNVVEPPVQKAPEVAQPAPPPMGAIKIGSPTPGAYLYINGSIDPTPLTSVRRSEEHTSELQSRGHL